MSYMDEVNAVLDSAADDAVEQAEKILQKEIDSGNHAAALSLCEVLLDYGEISEIKDKVVGLLETACENGNVQSSYVLYCLYSGKAYGEFDLLLEEVPANREKADFYFGKGLELGHPDILVSSLRETQSAGDIESTKVLLTKLVGIDFETAGFTPEAIGEYEFLIKDFSEKLEAEEAFQERLQKVIADPEKAEPIDLYNSALELSSRSRDPKLVKQLLEIAAEKDFPLAKKALSEFF